MGDEDEGVFILLEISLQPLDVLHVQVVGGLVQQQDVGLFQQQLSQKNLGSLSAGELCHVLVKPQLL